MATNKRYRRPRIGISGPAEGGRILWWFTKLAIQLGGGKPVRITPKTRIASLEGFDGFVISGGGDINPEMYGEAALKIQSQFEPARDALEKRIITHALEHKLPLLGICRGMQMLNVVCDGSLYQEAKDILEDFLPNDKLISKIIGRREVKVDKESRLYEVLGGYESYFVNSIHHQAVNRLGEGLHVVAKEDNGLIQEVEPADRESDHYLFGVQWHPELMLHARSSRRLFRCLVQKAKEHVVRES